MIRRPPRSTLFPTRRSSDLGELQRAADRLARVGDDDVDAAVGREEGGGQRGAGGAVAEIDRIRSEEHTSELQSRRDLVCRLLLEKKKEKERKHHMSKSKEES